MVVVHHCCQLGLGGKHITAPFYLCRHLGLFAITEYDMTALQSALKFYWLLGQVPQLQCVLQAGSVMGAPGPWLPAQRCCGEGRRSQQRLLSSCPEKEARERVVGSPPAGVCLRTGRAGRWLCGLCPQSGAEHGAHHPLLTPLGASAPGLDWQPLLLQGQPRAIRAIPTQPWVDGCLRCHPSQTGRTSCPGPWLGR